MFSKYCFYSEAGLFTFGKTRFFQHIFGNRKSQTEAIFLDIGCAKHESLGLCIGSRAAVHKYIIFRVIFTNILTYIHVIIFFASANHAPFCHCVNVYIEVANRSLASSRLYCTLDKSRISSFIIQGLQNFFFDND